MRIVVAREMVKNFSNFKIISTNSELNENLTDHNLVTVPSEDTNNVNTTTPSAVADSVTSLVRKNVCGGGVVGEKFNWNFFQHFDQVDNQLRIEVLHVPKYCYIIFSL